MTTPSDLCLLLFDANARISSAPAALAAMAELAAPLARRGNNGLFIPSGTLELLSLTTPNRRELANHPAPFDFQIFNTIQRRRTQATRTRLRELDPMLAVALPCVEFALIRRGANASVYRYVHEGEAGALFLHLLDLAPFDHLTWADASAAARRACEAAVGVRALLSDDCWYTRWHPEMELERKFTSRRIPNMWRLATAFHAAVADGRVDGLVLEIDRDFQTMDYESHIFEVGGDPAESGYISFIPQADGLMAVKRKWFVENAELRREDFVTNQAIPFASIGDHARAMTPATVRRLQPFRRTRIDVNLESLETGNGFGVYFDVCLSLDGRAGFGQIEVEYCRSRTFKPLHDIERDFEHISGVVEQFLAQHAPGFRHNLYSKLDFSRELSALAA
ncbi:hypothetical protein [Burkholderia catarinensis]|uniref:hypothetical protein n=1 Tax=Burkholderia catarinensis TaxID=1108140 RepID=UPI0009103350|nr:hypothetical protein [Burkholderia catarinensis]KAG8148788.1 hypothetical protein BFF94_035945 [Burkholderia catarinensis]